MAQFKYSAQSPKGSVVSGTIEATGREAALETLRNQQLKPISVEETKKTSLLSMQIGGNKVPNKELVIFTRQLSTMVSAGVPIMQALTTLAKQVESPAFKKVLGEVTKDIQSGMALGDAFDKHPNAFNEIYVNMVKAGEAGGILDEILKKLATQQEKSESIRKKVKSAMTYPIILMVITVGAFFGLFLFIIPKIGGIMHDLAGPNAQLPAITRAMLGLSDFMTARWYIIIGGLALVIFFVRRWLKTKAGRSQFHHWILKVPAIGPIVSKLAVARFARTFASLMAAGVSVLEALKVTGGAVGNEAFREAIDKAAEEVKAGQQLSHAIEHSKLFPAIVPQMLAVGEDTGKTDEVLVKVADFYEEEVDAAIAGISSIIEPVMIVIMGALVGLVAVSVMGPIANLSNQVGS
ncbi:MAG TPA: type II secretion system F family protein [Candidatus Saccharimonadales bacterium]|nr:type II secretion system F family protein [Candidatus Saccharimonadales bacterium]